MEINYIKTDDTELEKLQPLTNPVAESCSKSYSFSLMQKLSVFSGLLNIITVLASKLYRLNYPSGTKWRFRDEITGCKSIGIS